VERAAADVEIAEGCSDVRAEAGHEPDICQEQRR